jgi:hypothetical protein
MANERQIDLAQRWYGTAAVINRVCDATKNFRSSFSPESDCVLSATVLTRAKKPGAEK